MIDFNIDTCKFIISSERFSSLMQRFTGIKWIKHGFAEVPATIYNAGIISQHLPNDPRSEAAARMLAAMQSDYARIVEFIRGKMMPGWEKLPSPFQLFEHQARAVYGLQQMEFRGILADEMGLGKTQVAITCYRCCVPQPLLVVCPASIKWKWKNDLEANGIDAHVIDGYQIYPGKAISIPARIVNYDLLSRRPELVQDLTGFIRAGFLILDESHYVKDATSKRTRACQKFNPRHILLLTGTPIRNTIVDLFPQVNLVRPGIWRNRWEFEDRYQIREEKYFGSRKVLKAIGTRNEGELNAILETIQIRRLKKDVMNLPEKVRSVIPLDFDSKSREVYEKMAKKWLYDFQDLSGEVPILDNRAKTAMEAALRLEQICQGILAPVPVTLADRLALSEATPHEIVRGGWLLRENPKFAWLKELLDDLGQKKVVCFFRFNASLDACFSQFNNPEMRKIYGHPSMLVGDTPPSLRPGLILNFQTSKVDRLFLIQVKIAEGFDLTAAQDVVFWGRDWSPAVNAQAEDRVHRIGQTGTVNIYIPIIKDSIEERLHVTLEQKEGVAKMVLGDIRKAIEETV